VTPTLIRYESRIPKEFRENVQLLQRERMIYSLHSNNSMVKNSASIDAVGLKGKKVEIKENKGGNQNPESSILTWKRDEASMKTSSASTGILPPSSLVGKPLGQRDAKLKILLAEVAKKKQTPLRAADKQMLTQKQTCSQTLMELSSDPDPENIEMMARNGGIESITELSKIDDETTLSNWYKMHIYYVVQWSCITPIVLLTHHLFLIIVLHHC
jgi:hypothetical protein